MNVLIFDYLNISPSPQKKEKRKKRRKKDKRCLYSHGETTHVVIPYQSSNTSDSNNISWSGGHALRGCLHHETQNCPMSNGPFAWSYFEKCNFKCL